MREIIYNICSANVWARVIVVGVFAGAPVDLQNGYIHLSAEPLPLGADGAHVIPQGVAS